MTEIKTGTVFRKVGTDSTVTVTKVDEEKGMAVVKFASGRSIPMSFESLSKTDKWEVFDGTESAVETEKTEQVDNTKKKKPMAKKSKAKIREQLDDIIETAIQKCNKWNYIMEQDKKSEIEYTIWIYGEKPQIQIKYIKKSKTLEILFDDDTAEMLKGTEFDEPTEMTETFIEDKLTTLLNIIVEKVNTKESEEKTNGTI